jgi:hypothetical protein
MSLDYEKARKHELDKRCEFFRELWKTTQFQHWKKELKTIS